MSRTQKLKGFSAASLRLKTLNDNPYVESEDWDYCERMEYRHCLWRGSVCTVRRNILSEKNLRE